jgi:hypothetical protein
MAILPRTLDFLLANHSYALAAISFKMSGP